MATYTIICDKKKKICTSLPKLSGKRDVSIVVPTYNEQDNIRPLVKGISKALKGKYTFEIVIVDDASKDNTQNILTELALKDSNVFPVMREGIRGIWSAQHEGLLLARGKTIVFMDADLSHPPEKIPELLKYIPEYDFVSASRYVSGGGMKGLPFKHKISTVLFNKVIKHVLNVVATDFTGVFHAIKKDKLLKILPQSDSVGGAFDLDLLYYAKKQGLKFKEVPFVYVYRVAGNSKSRKMSSLAFSYGLRALKLRLFGKA